ncbi:MAG TPA: hypothetical protein VNK44_06765 [Candidatus Nitrosotenuis sp.]|nr:hypothetical protein [Candidatus Nitrosotenuis sp.]
MQKIPALVSIFVALLSLQGLAFADDEPHKIISQCEKIFPDLEKLGKAKFEQRYLHFTHIRSCYVLYNEPVWYSTGEDRMQRLTELLQRPQTTIPIRDRFVQSENIPQWIKDDATRWHQGKEKDNVFSYGIRYMINSKMLYLPIGVFDPQSCDPDSICISKDDYLKYSVKDSRMDDTATQTHTFGDGGSYITVSITETSKTGRKTDLLRMQNDGLLVGDQKKYYQFVHKIPLKIGDKVSSIHDLVITGQIYYSFKDAKREALLAWDATKQYYEVIDKQTGVVLYAKQENRILKSEWSAKLVDTNVFAKEIKIQYEDMRIPSWFRSTVKWWTEGKITDKEYLDSLSYLLKNNIMQI